MASVQFVGTDIKEYGGYKFLVVEFSIGADLKLVQE